MIHRGFSSRSGLVLLAIFLVMMLNGCSVVPFLKNADYIEPTTGMAFVSVPGGTYKMGDATGIWNESQRPTHSVQVAGFYAGQHEVTFAQYDLFCEATNRVKPVDEGWGRGQQPVINVSWEDAVAFAEWMSTQSGAHVSLPSEAQWEYLARAGTRTQYWQGELMKDGAANCADCGSRWDNTSTAPIGSFSANPWSIHDTAGNVAEWCLDTVHKDYTGAPADARAWEGGQEERRILRGGSWSHSKGDLRPAFRDWDNKLAKLNNVGFRLIIHPPLPNTK